MKLIDILVEELPKRGGWLVGANYCHSMYENIYFSINKPERAPNGRLNSKDGDREVDQLLLGKVFSSGAGVEEVTREQYEAALAAKNDENDLNECIEQDAVPIWSGEGQPSVGLSVNIRGPVSRGPVA